VTVALPGPKLDAMSDAAQLARRSARALGWSWAGALARAALQLAAQVVLARLLGPAAWGQAAAVLLAIGVASLVAEGGLSAALIQRQHLQPADAGLALGWTLLVSALVAGIVAALVAPLAAAFEDPGLAPLLWAAAAIVPLHALATLPGALLQRRFEARRLQAIQFIAYALAYGVAGVGAALAGAGAWSLLIAFALHALLVGVLCAASAGGMRWRPRLGTRDERAALLGYGWRTMLANLVNWGIESVDRLLVGAQAGAAALGLYSVAANLARAPVASLVSAAQPVAFAAASRLQGEHQRLARGYLAMLTLALLATLPLFSALAWFAPLVVELLYGSAWRAAAAPFAWLCLGVPFFVMLAFTGAMLRGVDAMGSEMRAQLGVLALLAAALAIVLPQVTPAVRLEAAAALVSGATALRAGALAHALSHRVGLDATAPWRCWRGALLLAALVLALCALPAALALPSAIQSLLVLLLAPLLVALALRAAGAWLLGPDLLLALVNRAGDSPLAAALCRWCRIG
jgi:PST family polysaccharide transporter